jgi:hypothetical protein
MSPEYGVTYVSGRTTCGFRLALRLSSGFEPLAPLALLGTNPARGGVSNLRHLMMVFDVTAKVRNFA